MFLYQSQVRNLRHIKLLQGALEHLYYIRPATNSAGTCSYKHTKIARKENGPIYMYHKSLPQCIMYTAHPDV